MSLFFNQISDNNFDLYANIVLETLFENLYGCNSIHLSSEAGQIDHQDFNDVATFSTLPGSQN